MREGGCSREVVLTAPVSRRVTICGGVQGGKVLFSGFQARFSTDAFSFGQVAYDLAEL